MCEHFHKILLRKKNSLLVIVRRSSCEFTVDLWEQILHDTKKWSKKKNEQEEESLEKGISAKDDCWMLKKDNKVFLYNIHPPALNVCSEYPAGSTRIKDKLYFYYVRRIKAFDLQMPQDIRNHFHGFTLDLFSSSFFRSCNKLDFLWGGWNIWVPFG